MDLLKLVVLGSAFVMVGSANASKYILSLRKQRQERMNAQEQMNSYDSSPITWNLSSKRYYHIQEYGKEPSPIPDELIFGKVSCAQAGDLFDDPNLVKQIWAHNKPLRYMAGGTHTISCDCLDMNKFMIVSHELLKLVGTKNIDLRTLIRGKKILLSGGDKSPLQIMIEAANLTDPVYIEGLADFKNKNFDIKIYGVARVIFNSTF